MKNFKFTFGILAVTLTIILSGQRVSAAETETSYSYDEIGLELTNESADAVGSSIPGTDLDETLEFYVTPNLGRAAETSYSYDEIELELTNESADAVGSGIPGTNLDETLEFYVTPNLGRAAETSYSYDEIELELTNESAGAVGSGIPGTDLDDGLTFYVAAAEMDVGKTYDVNITVAGSVIVKVIQTTDWTYAPGISSTLTGHNILYQNIKAGYAIESGGSIKTTNNDGTQQIADYFRIFAPDGTNSNWYRILAVCSVNGVVSTSVKLLDY